MSMFSQILNQIEDRKASALAAANAAAEEAARKKAEAVKHARKHFDEISIYDFFAGEVESMVECGFISAEFSRNTSADRASVFVRFIPVKGEAAADVAQPGAGSRHWSFLIQSYGDDVRGVYIPSPHGGDKVLGDNISLDSFQLGEATQWWSTFLRAALE